MFRECCFRPRSFLNIRLQSLQHVLPCVADIVSFVSSNTFVAISCDVEKHLFITDLVDMFVFNQVSGIDVSFLVESK